MKRTKTLVNKLYPTYNTKHHYNIVEDKFRQCLHYTNETFVQSGERILFLSGFKKDKKTGCLVFYSRWK